MNVASPANSYVVVQRLKDHLREVLKGAEYEYREHRAKEKAWESEKKELEEELHVLKAATSTVVETGVTDEWKTATRSELESSLVSVTKERDLFKSKLVELGFSIQKLLQGNGLSLEKNPAAELVVKQKEEKGEDGVVEGANVSGAEDGEKKVVVDVSKLEKDSRIMNRLLEENKNLEFQIDSFESELEDAKVSVKRATNVVTKLSEDLDNERRAKSNIQAENDKLRQDISFLEKEKKGLNNRLAELSKIVNKFKESTGASK